VIGRIIHLNSSFSTLRFDHVLRYSNFEEDRYASLDTRQNEGTLIIKNEVTCPFITIRVIFFRAHFKHERKKKSGGFYV
jgi:hypothetical protein